MKPSFDLIREPWIPCIGLDGESVELGLADTLCRAHRIREVLDPSPPVTAALHRLLLAILHRVLGPSSTDEWRELWRAGQFDSARITDYLDHWSHRFDLFDEERPFYQTPGMAEKLFKPVSILCAEQASGNNATLFDHRVDAVPVAVSPARAARLAVALHLYSLGGLFAAETGRVSTTAAPGAGGALVLLTRASVFETLALNSAVYSPHHGAPLPSTGDDLPAWEQAEPVAPEVRLPRGYLDYLTWQSRRVLLRPEDDGAGGLRVSRVAVSNGLEFPGDYYPRDPLMAHLWRKTAKAHENPWPALRLSEARSLWRDSLALLGSLPEHTRRPAVVDQLAQMVGTEVPESAVYEVAVLGLCSSQAKVFFWRHERQPLPLAYLDSPELVLALADCLQNAEDAYQALRQGLWRLGNELLAPGEREPDRRALDQRLSAFPAASLYWSRLEPGFRRLVVRLARHPDEADAICARWRAEVEATAWRAFDDSADSLQPNARALRAINAGRGVLGHQLREKLGQPGEEHHAEAR